MKRASLAIAAVLAAAGMNATVLPGGGTLEVYSASVKWQQQAPAKQAPGDTKVNRLGFGSVATTSRRSGKRYSASVRQHQRNATKSRNKARSRR